LVHIGTNVILGGRIHQFIARSSPDGQVRSSISSVFLFFFPHGSFEVCGDASAEDVDPQWCPYTDGGRLRHDSCARQSIGRGTAGTYRSDFCEVAMRVWMEEWPGSLAQGTTNTS
jgi:hypothetical protein